MYARSMFVPVMLVLSWAGAHAEGGEGNNLAAAEIPGSTGIYNRMVGPQSLGSPTSNGWRRHARCCRMGSAPPTSSGRRRPISR